MDAIPTASTRTDTAPATLFVALELSRSTWLVALHSPVVDKVSQHRLEGGDTEGLLALITRKRLQAAEKLGRPVRVACCFEAGYDGFWLHRWLCSRGVENRVLDAASILVDRRARRAKTDRLDGGGLLRTLMALERGETQVCRVVHVPSPEQEDARRRCAAPAGCPTWRCPGRVRPGRFAKGSGRGRGRRPPRGGCGNRGRTPRCRARRQGSARCRAAGRAGRRCRPPLPRPPPARPRPRRSSPSPAAGGGTPAAARPASRA